MANLEYEDIATSKAIPAGSDIVTGQIPLGATFQSTFAPLYDRANATGTQLMSTVSDAGALATLKSNLAAAVAPVATDDSAAGYGVGSRWVDTTADKEYVCVDATATAAIWIETTGAGITDHGLLDAGSLLDDDHTQYLLVDGSRAATAGLDITSGVITADNPGIDITQTWNNAGVTFSGIKSNITNTASGAASLLLDLQVGGVSQFSIDKAGLLLMFGDTMLRNNGSNTELYAGGIRLFLLNTSNGGRIVLTNTGEYTWSSSATVYGAPDIFLVRDSAGVLADRDGTNPQTVRIYGTYTDASNYERLSICNQVADDILLKPESEGTGTLRGLQLVGLGGKLGFYGTTAIAKPSSTGETTGFTAGSGTAVNDDSTFTGNVGSMAYRLSDIVKHLKNLGLIET